MTISDIIIYIMLLIYGTSNKDVHINTSVLFVGDSQTCTEFGWQYILSKQNNYKYTTVSSVGKTTAWMLFNTKTHLNSSNNNYKILYVYGGINDIFSGINIDSAINNMQNIVILCNTHNILPIIVSGYDSENFMTTNTKTKNNYIKYQAKLLTIRNAIIIPIAPIGNKYTTDGIHMTIAGHKLLSNWINEHYKN